MFQFTATTTNPCDDVQFTFWKHKVTNMVLSAVRIALKEDHATDVNKLLFSSGDHNNVAVKAGDKRNLSGLLICHPLLLSSPFEEPANLDSMLDELLTERHPHVVAQSRGEYGEYEADKAYIRLTTLKKAAVIALRAIYKVASHVPCVSLGLNTGRQDQRVACIHQNQGMQEPAAGAGQAGRCCRNDAKALFIRPRTLSLSWRSILCRIQEISSGWTFFDTPDIRVLAYTRGATLLAPSSPEHPEHPNKVSQPCRSPLLNPTQEKPSEAQLKTASALRRNFKEAGNGSSIPWSRTSGMKTLKA